MCRICLAHDVSKGEALRQILDDSLGKAECHLFCCLDRALTFTFSHRLYAPRRVTGRSCHISHKASASQIYLERLDALLRN